MNLCAESLASAGPMASAKIRFHESFGFILCVHLGKSPWSMVLCRQNPRDERENLMSVALKWTTQIRHCQIYISQGNRGRH